MKRGERVIFCIFILILMAMSFPVHAGLEPIIENEDDLIIGAKGYYIAGDYKGYLHGAYNFDIDDMYYRVGSRYRFNRQVSINISSYYWFVQQFSNYPDLIGINLKTNYHLDTYHQISIDFFSGTALDRKSDQVKTNFLKMNYNGLVHTSGDKVVKVNSHMNLGLNRGTGQGFYKFDLAFPSKIDDLEIKPAIGLIKIAPPLDTFYDMAYIIRGYGKNSLTGHAMWSCTIEKKIPLFPNSTNVILGSTTLPIFSDFGRAFEPGQDILGPINYNIGVGIDIDLGRSNLRLEEVVTDKGKWSTRFNIETEF